MTSVWRGIAEVPPGVGPTVVTVGSFDGVHKGHQAVLGSVVEIAKERGAASVAVTFDPHPKAVHDPEHPPALITGLADRVERILDCGIDHVLVQPYSLDWALQTPEQFVRDYLVGGLGAVAIAVGRDTKFGRGNAGDVTTLRALAGSLGFEAVIVDDASGSLEGTRRWSSTWVRELLEEGDLDAAAQVMGYYHRLRGTIVHGDALGRDIGFPTANVDVTDGYIPRHGVYAGRLRVVAGHGNEAAEALKGVVLPSAVSLGVNYTVGGTELRVEAHVIDRAGLNLYDAEVTLDLVAWRRPMLDFGSLDGLIAALGEDVAWTREVLGKAGERP